MQAKTKKIIARTGAGLRDAMFDVLERLRDGEMEPAEAKEMANVARVIIECAEMQMDFEERKSDSTIPKHLSEMSLVPPLSHIENKDDKSR